MIRIDVKLFILALMICAAALLGTSPAFCKENHEETLKQNIRQHINSSMLHPVENVRIEFLSKLPSIDNLSGKITYNIESRTGEEFLGDTSFNIRIFDNGVFLKEEPVRVRIEVLREFVVSVNNIVRDSILSADDVTVQKKWVKRIPMNTVSSVEDVIGKTITVSIRPHAQITRSMLKEVKAVKKGKMVQVILNNGAMKIMSSGIAEEDGAEDSTVKVRNLSSNRIIYARVIGPSKVQVDF